MSTDSTRIRMVVVAAADLIKWHVFRSPDAFAVVKVDGQQIHTTGVIPTTRNPYWDEDFDIIVHDFSVIAIDIFDRYLMEGRRRLLGRTSFRVTDVLDFKHGGSVTQRFKLDKLYDNVLGRGGLLIHLTTDTSKPIRNPGPGGPDVPNVPQKPSPNTLEEETNETEAIKAYNLAIKFLAMFHQEGRVSDLDPTVALFRDGFTLLPAGHKYQWRFLDNLAHSLGQRFEKMSEMEDLDEIIALHRGALKLQQEEDDKPARLNSLAFALRIRYDHGGLLVDLDEAVGLDREALDLRPSNHPKRPASLKSLERSLQTRFEKTARSADLKELSEVQTELKALPPSPTEHRYQGPFTGCIFGGPLVNNLLELSVPGAGHGATISET